MGMKTNITDEQIKRFEQSIRKWSITRHGKLSKKDPKMEAMYRRDRADLRKALQLIKQKKYADAAKVIYHFDTIVRDQVPVDIYNALPG